jgi:hypothetical protein
MAQGLLTREPIAEFGELRAYLRAERQEIAFEAFREADGRAWLLRVPLAARAALVALLRDIGAILAEVADGTPDPGILHQVAIGPKDQLTALLLVEGRERAFALWRREQLRDGWSWTVDVVVVPVELARRLCAVVADAVERTTYSPSSTSIQLPFGSCAAVSGAGASVPPPRSFS